MNPKSNRSSVIDALRGYFILLIGLSKDKPFAFPKRIFILFLLWIFNNFFFYGDILKEYTIIGLIIFLARHI